MYFSLVSPKENATSILLGRCKVLQPSKKSLSSCLSAGAGCFQSVFASFFFRINSVVDLRGEFGLGRVWGGAGWVANNVTFTCVFDANCALNLPQEVVTHSFSKML